MRVFETIVRNSVHAAEGSPLEPIHDVGDFPVVILSCIDPRLNRLLPTVLGLTETQFIWLRNAGNIIFDPMSSMMRTLALGCAVKGGKEIAIIGHTDCQVSKISVAELTERFRKLGVERSRLPDNLTEFFGLFASERQNVLRGAQIIRSSPLIGPGIRVHGLLLDVTTRRLDWVVNGYETPVDLPAERSQNRATQTLEAAGVESITLAPFSFGEMKFPEAKIGETGAMPHADSPAPSTVEKLPGSNHAGAHPPPLSAVEADGRKGARPSLPDQGKRAGAEIDPKALFKIIGDDNAVYGPVSGRTLMEWMADKRIDGATLVQSLGLKDGKEWRPLAVLLGGKPPQIPPTPPVGSSYEAGSSAKRK